MTDVVHSTFTIERTYTARPARVFAAWADPEKKAAWFFGPPPWRAIERTMDFRVGGRDVAHGRFGDGMVSIFRSTYFDIVPDERIIYGYDMEVDGKRISVSLATILIAEVDGGTRMSVTEQGTFFDDTYGPASREEGTLGLVAQLGASLAV